MSKSLRWYKDGDDLPPKAYGHGGTRLYQVHVQAHGRWMATLSYDGATGVLARGWALSPDEAKRIAQEWEDGFERYVPDAAGQVDSKGKARPQQSATSKNRVRVVVAAEEFSVRSTTAERIKRIAAADLKWAGGPPLYPGAWAAEHGEDIYRIWSRSGGGRSPDSYDLWWWDGPYTGSGEMAGDLRDAENAYLLDTYPSLGKAKTAAARHARSKDETTTLF